MRISKILFFTLVAVFLISIHLQASEKSDLSVNKSEKRQLASDQDGDINTPYTPAYLEKIDSSDRNSDPEYVEESQVDRSQSNRR